MRPVVLATTLAMMMTPTLGSAQGINAPACPSGYSCIPDDSLAGSFQREREERASQLLEADRAACRNRVELNEALDVAAAAQSQPGSPSAVASALSFSRLYGGCP